MRATFRAPVRIAIAGAVILALPAVGVAAEPVDGRAGQAEQFFQPLLRAELEVVRRTCGSLAADARHQIAAAGRDGVCSTAKRFAAWEAGGQKGGFDPREAIHEAVAAAVKLHATPKEFMAYGREHLDRHGRRGRAARLLIIARVDQELELSAAQRAAIEADLERRWEAGWILQLDDDGSGMINDRRPVADFADACIAPHLDDQQRAVWTQKCQQHGFVNNMGGAGGGPRNWRPFDGPSLEPDPWWAP